MSIKPVIDAIRDLRGDPDLDEMDLDEIHAHLSAVSVDLAARNTAKLTGCVDGHNFVPIKNTMLSKCKCTKCGGVVDGGEAAWYISGLRDGEARK